METLAIQGEIEILTVESGDAYAAALRRNSDLSVLPAKYVVYPAVYEDISSILSYALKQSPPLEIAVKGGGAHSSTWASSNGGVVIDLGKLKKVTIFEDKQYITVQGGALWGDVYEVTAREHVDVVGSPLWFAVGVGGFTLGGGYGPLSGQYGLAIDNMISATVVLANGRIVKTSREEEPDLFWAIRGGGGQFGIVVDITFKVHSAVGPIGCGIISYPGSELEQLLKIIGDWKRTMTPQERFTMSFSRPAPHFKPSIVILPTILHDQDGSKSQEVLKPFREGSANPSFYNIRQVPDMLAVSHSADVALSTAPRSLVIRGTLFSDFFPELLLTVWEKWVEFTEGNEDVRASTVLWDLTHPGSITGVSSADTALPARSPHYWMAVQGRSTTAISIKAAQEFTTSVVSFVRSKNTELSGKDLGWFLNLAQGDESAEDVFGTNLPRLSKLKARYDPKKVWSKGLVIDPAKLT
ncbi:FAD-binding domain-containing protein [Lentinula detonsa]|uniref:FAD-binding domain-containing protein n=1 Tax=Lentinula detonsa TaxID=2804962 RepID=A0AA38PVP4_9AGAR|nr:FAD-binding domain-containing protein [Lentinula detonsa]